MKAWLGVAVLGVSIALTGCEDRGDGAKRELKELAPGEQTNRERAEKAGEEVREAGDEVRRQAREGSREVRRDAREAREDAEKETERK
jgi:hypothetical protein